MNEKALEAAAQELAAWIGYAYEGLQDRDISAEFSDWCYNGIGDRGMQGGKPAVRKACQRIVSSYLAAAPGEYAGLMERLRMDVEPTDGDMEDAADAIATLSAKLAAAEAELAQCRKEKNALVLKAYPAMDALDAALAREAKLREALDEARLILAGGDIGSLPNDYPMDRLASDRMGDLERARSRIETLEAAINNPPRHKFWGAGDPDCPREIKAGNGELHTLRCKVCGVDDPRHDLCRAALGLTDGQALIAQGGQQQRPPTITDADETLKRLGAGDTITYSQDGDAAWFTGGDRAFVGQAAVLSLRSRGFIERKCDDDENYRGMSEYDAISDAGRAALTQGGKNE